MWETGFGDPESHKFYIVAFMFPDPQFSMAKNLSGNRGFTRDLRSETYEKCAPGLLAWKQNQMDKSSAFLKTFDPLIMNFIWKLSKSINICKLRVSYPHGSLILYCQWRCISVKSDILY